MRLPKLLVILSGLWIGSALAAPVLELPGEMLLAQGVELRSRLNVNAALAGAWLQAESRTRAMLQERRARHERLQMDIETALMNNQNGLAELVSRIDADESQTLDENRGLRQTWLRVFDGLDAAQRRALADAIHADLQTQAPQPSTTPKPTDDSSRRQGRGGKSSRGSAGGIGGIGGGAGGF